MSGGNFLSPAVIYKTTNGGTILVNNIVNNIPDKYYLYQNYPNPFNPVTKIKFDIPANVKGETSDNESPLNKGGRWGLFTTLKIYDITGKEITTIVDEKLTPGTYEFNFNAGNLPSGIYFYKLQTGDFVMTRKALLIK